jgi:hypothetical protein
MYMTGILTYSTVHTIPAYSTVFHYFPLCILKKSVQDIFLDGVVFLTLKRTGQFFEVSIKTSTERNKTTLYLITVQ